jgi:hypothetical protein
MDLTSLFRWRQHRCAHALISWARAEINTARSNAGVWGGTANKRINGLTYPVFQYFQFASHGTLYSGDSGDAGGGGGGDGGGTCPGYVKTSI